MAKILRTLAPVDSMSGMVGKRDETTSNKAFIINVKKVGGWKLKGAPFMYFSLRQNDRLSDPSSSEIAHRQKFATCVANTYEAMIDPNLLPQLQLGFKNQEKYSTLYGYVFSLEWEKL